MNNIKLTVSDFKNLKNNSNPFIALTVYDFPTAQIIDQLNIPFALVGDSASMVVYGYDNTIPINMEEMLLITKAVSRGLKNTFLIGDMPFMSYQPSAEIAVQNAGKFVKEGKVDAIKLEGGTEYLTQILEIIKSGIPVMGHIGLKPQSVLKESGYKIQGKNLKDAIKIYKDAIVLEQAGVFAIVLEGVPKELAQIITEKLNIPTIGIGAGKWCDGQIQVLHDILGLLGENVPKHSRAYINMKNMISDALLHYQSDVSNKMFPKNQNAVTMNADTLSELKNKIENF